MEFIPLEKYSKKSKKTESVKVEGGEKSKKVKKDEGFKKAKAIKQSKVFERKNVKNKYRENLTLKRKVKKDRKKIKEDEVKEEDDDEEEKEEMGEEEEDVEDEQEEKKDDAEEAFKRKCKEMDEKKKNRLFVKLKKKIRSEEQIKQLHPDIRGVIFPRKKNSRWCWAVFASEERADEALKQLIKNKEVFATKPTPYDKVDQRRKEKMKTLLRKKESRKKLQEMWM